MQLVTQPNQPHIGGQSRTFQRSSHTHGSRRLLASGVHDNSMDEPAGTAVTSLTGGTVVGEAVTVMVLETGALASVALLATSVTGSHTVPRRFVER